MYVNVCGFCSKLEKKNVIKLKDEPNDQLGNNKYI